MNAPEPVAAILERFLREEGWEFSHAGEDEAYLLSFAGDERTWECLALAREAERQVVFYSLCPAPVSRGAGAEILLLTNRVNWDLVVGDLEYDAGSGQVRLRTSVELGVNPEPVGLVRVVVHANLLLMNAYIAAVEAVASGEQGADEALALVRNR